MFILGLVCVTVGLALAVLPGPLTIPPVLLGLWIWSKEFNWADRHRVTVSARAKAVSTHARQHPLPALAAVAGGFAATTAAVLVARYLGVVTELAELTRR